MIDEIADTIERLRDEFDSLAVRGIRAAGPENVALLKAAAEEFQRIGAEHMAERIGDVVAGLANGDRSAAAALLRAQTSLRLFDRVLTLDVAAGSLSALVEETSDDPDEEA
jgi:hypothetical protein